MDGLIVFLAAYLIYFVVLLAVFTFYIVNNRRQFVLTLLFGGLAAVLLAAVAGWLYSHPRPFVALDIEPLIEHGADNAFPSMHTVLAMTISSVIYFYRRRLAAVALIVTLLVGTGRVWAHVHWWIDIAGGLLVGAIAGYAGIKLARKAEGVLSARQPVSRH